MPAGLSAHPGKGSLGLRGTLPFIPLEQGIQLQTRRHWGLGEDLAKLEEKQTPGQHLAGLKPYWALQRFSCWPLAL